MDSVKEGQYYYFLGFSIFLALVYLVFIASIIYDFQYLKCPYDKEQFCTRCLKEGHKAGLCNNQVICQNCG